MLMQVSSAIRLINSLVYLPGWAFEATDHCNRFEDSVSVTITYPAVETNKDKAEEGYPLENRPHASFPLMVGAINDDIELYRLILHVIGEINTHEAREALRVQPTYWAPFHPHKQGGIAAWIDTENVCAQHDKYLPDLKFGIA
jgi:hypothetical protein